MSIKNKCLAIDDELICKKLGAGMFTYYQIFKGPYFFSDVAKTAKCAWALALKILMKENN